MAIKYDIPLYENTEEQTHCVQACYRMVLKHYLPSKEYSWDELDEASAKQKDLWTWPMAGLCWLKQQGFDIIYIEDFDYEAFLERKGDYLTERYGIEIADEQIKHSDIESELQWVDTFLKTITIENRPATLSEIFKYLDDGYLVITAVNYSSLHDKPGYVGHSVLVCGYDEENIILNEPGLPGIKAWTISHEQFLKGWSYPDEATNNITAVRPV